MIRTAKPDLGSSPKPAGIILLTQDHADGPSRRSFLTTEQRPALPHPQDLSMEKTTQSSHADEAESFEVTSDAVELPLGSSFTVRPGPIKFFELAIFLIGERLIIGRWLPDPEDGDSIWQPRRRIRITGKVPFRIVGAIVPDPELAGWPSAEISL